MTARHIQSLVPQGGTTGRAWPHLPGIPSKQQPTNFKPQFQPPIIHRGASAVTSTTPGEAPKLLDQVSNVLRTNHYSLRTEKAYNDWIYRFIIFHNKRHPREMGAAEIGQFLTHLAQAKHVAPSTQNQALCAIIFLYKRVLNLELGEAQFPWAKRPEHLPVILSLEEVRKLLASLPARMR